MVAVQEIIRVTCRQEWLGLAQVVQPTDSIRLLVGYPKVSYVHNKASRRVLCGAIELLFR